VKTPPRQREAQLLVVAPRDVGAALAAQAEEGSAVAMADPYDAIEEMGRRDWPAVLLAAPSAELGEIARATRRLQKRSRIVALCSPAQEAEVLPLAPEVVDDYLIHPASRADLAGIIARARRSGPAAAQDLSAAELADLIESARGLAALEKRVAQLVSSRIGEPVRWIDAPPASPAPRGAGEEKDIPSRPAGEPPAAQPLLAVDDPPRWLVPQGAGRAARNGQAIPPSLAIIVPALRRSARRAEVLRRLSITDDLTNVYNRRYFHRLAGEVIEWSRTRGAKATLLVYDIDNFKRYNDEFGHPVGDEILRETALMMKQITRSQDIVARIGGDEFAVLFWESEPPRAEGSRPVQKAYALSDRFRRAVAGRHFHALGPQAKGALTISGGLASFPRDGENIEDLLSKADEALYAAKRSGKNAIRIIGPE
jgi:diguanylate cyclase (GGDEF)-like protein